MATKAQIKANRKNSKKSTGPKSPSGKAKTKLNGLKHGLRAQEVVLPTENLAEFQAFVDAWMADWNPPTMARAQLVEDAAVAAWRKKRCVRVEAARISKRIRLSHAKWDRDEQARVDALVEPLGDLEERLDDDDPGDAVAALLATRAGVARMAAMWDGLAGAAADPAGWNDFEEHHLRLFTLQGRMPGDDDMREFFEASWRLLMANNEDYDDEELEPYAPAEATAAAAVIRKFALGRSEALREVWQSLPDDSAARDAQAELDAFAPHPEDAPLLRYEAQLSRQFHRALGDLVKLTKSGDDLAGAIEDEEAPTEANLAEVAVDEGVNSGFSETSGATDEAGMAAAASARAAEGREGVAGAANGHPGRPATAPKRR